MRVQGREREKKLVIHYGTKLEILTLLDRIASSHCPSPSIVYDIVLHENMRLFNSYKMATLHFYNFCSFCSAVSKARFDFSLSLQSIFIIHDGD